MNKERNIEINISGTVFKTLFKGKVFVCLVFFLFLSVFILKSAEVRNITLLVLPYPNFETGQTVQASEMNANYQAILNNVKINNYSLDDRITVVNSKVENNISGNLRDKSDTNLNNTNLLEGELLLQKGFIAIWSGRLSEVPIGWALCDGTGENGSKYVGYVKIPDLRDKFVRGASNDISIRFGENSEDDAGSITHSHIMQHKHSGAYVETSSLLAKDKHRHEWINRNGNDWYTYLKDGEIYVNSKMLTVNSSFYEEDSNVSALDLYSFVYNDSSKYTSTSIQGTKDTMYTNKPMYENSSAQIVLNDSNGNSGISYGTTFSDYGNGQYIFTSEPTKLADSSDVLDNIGLATDVSTGIVNVDNTAFKEKIKLAEGHLPSYISFAYIIYVGDTYNEADDGDAQKTFRSEDY